LKSKEKKNCFFGRSSTLTLLDDTVSLPQVDILNNSWTIPYGIQVTTYLLYSKYVFFATDCELIMNCLLIPHRISRCQFFGAGNSRIVHLSLPESSEA